LLLTAGCSFAGVLGGLADAVVGRTELRAVHTAEPLAVGANKFNAHLGED